MSRVLPERIAINAIFLLPGMGGLDTYVRELVGEMVIAAPSTRFRVYCSPRGRDHLALMPWAGEVALVSHPLLGTPGLKAITELTVLGALASRQADLLHSVALTAPLHTRAVNVVTIADTTWLTGPAIDNTTRLWRLLVPPVARRADRLIAISQAGAADISARLRVPPDRVDVTLLGHSARPATVPHDHTAIRGRYGLGDGPLVLSVGTRKPHKNVLGVIRAMPAVIARFPDARLVLAGNATSHETELKAEVSRLGLGAAVAFLPFVDDAELERLYAEATCFVMASFNEGFGLPLLEAMSRSVPVASSQAAALPEVAGDAALMFDPYDPAGIAARIVELLGDSRLREDLRARGRARATALTWAATAEATLDTYARVGRPSASTAVSLTMTQPDVLDTREAGGLLLRGSVLRMASFVATVGLSVVSATLLTRHLGVARFGQYTTVLSLVAVVAAVTDAGMSTYGTREYATRDEEDRRQFMAVLLGLRVVLTLIGSVLTVAFAVAAGYDGALILGAIAASLATVPLVFQHTLSIPLSTELRLGTLSALELVRQTLLVAGLVALVIAGAGVLPLLAVSLLANALLIWPTAQFVRGRVALRPALRPSRWPPLLRSTAVFSVATAVGTIYVYAAQILTSLVTDHHQSGLFAVSFRVFIVAGSVPGLLVGAALPLLSRAARDDADRLAYALARIFETALVCGVGLSIGVSAGAGFIVSVIAGPKYASAHPVLAIQAWAMVGSFAVAGWSFALLSLHEHRQLLAINFLALTVSLVLTLLLAASDGAQGAAIATVAGESVLALLTGVALGRHRSAYRPPRPVIGKVLIAAALAVPVAYLPSLSSFVRAVLALSLYVLLVLALRAVPTELTELLPSRRR